MQLHTTKPCSLDALRSEIDAIDNQILTLVERRTALARKIAQAKAERDTAEAEIPLRPIREEQLLARLANRAGSVPPASIRTIWRELMSLSLQAQRRTEIVLCAGQDNAALTQRAMRRFGSGAPLRPLSDSDIALEAARVDGAIAVIELRPGEDWWLALDDDPDLSIIAELREPGMRHPALCIARVAECHLAKERRWLVLDGAQALERIMNGETLCPIASAGTKRLCVVEQIEEPMRGAA